MDNKEKLIDFGNEFFKVEPLEDQENVKESTVDILEDCGLEGDD